MTTEEKENQILALKKIGLTDKEIAEIQESDKRIDNGELLFELPRELRQGSKKARSAGNVAGYVRTAPIQKIGNTEKQNLIQEILTTIQNMGATELKVPNKEREIVFMLNGTKYKIMLSCPRK